MAEQFVRSMWFQLNISKLLPLQQEVLEISFLGIEWLTQQFAFFVFEEPPNKRRQAFFTVILVFFNKFLKDVFLMHRVGNVTDSYI
jgi:hypothetical protein